MKVVLQRVAQASVSVDLEKIGQIDRGYVLLLGVGQEDTKIDCEKLVEKIVKLRLFSDDAGKMNLSLLDIGASVLSISQFTLFASVKKGNRPSFTQAGDPQVAKELYQYFNECMCRYVPVETGIFGADMQVELINDGPVTIVLDSKEL